MIELSNVCKRYGEAVALHPVDLTFDAQKTYVLIGPSGCGKSTILRLIIGLVRPDHGSVRIDGEEFNDASAMHLRRHIGYVIQDGGLFPHLTIRENVSLMAEHLRWPREQIDRRVAELAQLTQLPETTLPRYPTQLSGGQQQRVGLMRALMLDPEVLLLDEPLGALDPMIRSELQQDLRRIIRGLGKTVVLVTHDLHEAVFFADEIVLMREGRLELRGTAADLLAAPEDSFAAQFIRAQQFALSAATLADTTADREPR